MQEYSSDIEGWSTSGQHMDTLCGLSDGKEKLQRQRDLGPKAELATSQLSDHGQVIYLYGNLYHGGNSNDFTGLLAGSMQEDI